MYMHIYTYMYVCIYVYICMYVCIYVCMYVCMYVFMYIFCMYVCIHVCMYVCTYVYMYVYNVCMYVYMWVRFDTVRGYPSKLFYLSIQLLIYLIISWLGFNKIKPYILSPNQYTMSLVPDPYWSHPETQPFFIHLTVGLFFPFLVTYDLFTVFRTLQCPLIQQDTVALLIINN